MTLSNAIGTIQASAGQQDRLDEITERVRSGEFYVTIEATIPSKCIDGRIGSAKPAPNSAGGTESLMVADDLTVKRFVAPTTLEAYSNVLMVLQEAGKPIGGHTDEYARDGVSGCGANDRLQAIYEFISAQGDVLRKIALRLGMNVDEPTHRLILRNAAARTDFSLGSELLTVLQTAGGDVVVDLLQGEHKEVIAVINTVAGTTLDRGALESEFGQNYEAFNVDVWSFSDAAAAIAENESDIMLLVHAMVYYNLATAHVLCGPNMRVIAR